MSESALALPESREWINGVTARRKLNISHAGLQRLVVLRMIQATLIPGLPPRYSAADINRVAASIAAARAS